jgi:hypothetical protein
MVLANIQVKAREVSSFLEMWVHQSVDWSKNVSLEVGEGGEAEQG